VHSEYSLLDGSAKITELVARAKELDMDSLAITDHGVMYGVIDFYKAAVAKGIKPILGCEVYVALGSRLDKDGAKDNAYYHLVLLAENQTGYHNLIKLVSFGFTEGFYYKPRVDTDLLRRYSEGLICLSACLSGPVSKNLLNATYEYSLQQALLYDGIFGRGNFYLELQDHGLPDQRRVNPQLVSISRETGIPLVCTNDSHYISKEDAAAHEILLCIQTNKTMNDDDRMRYPGGEFYLKSPEEMAALFSYAPESVANTQVIAGRCNVEIRFNEYKLPRFAVPGADAYEYLRGLCMAGLGQRYSEITPQLLERMNYELDVIHGMGFVDYFLIVWDFIKYANDQDIIVGPGRGSAAGSIVAYCLRITNIDPIKYDLLFERFLNPERISMPDIDIDFCYERRQEVIDYVIRKYGADHVAQIITFGTMGARAVIRDVGRALAMPYGDVDRIAKMVPFALGMTIDKALELNPDLARARQEEEDTRKLLDFSLRLEGLPRHASTHAAGVVICNEPVTEYVPLNQNDGVITTQFNMTLLEELGLLKMDFLGLRTLTVIQNATRSIKAGHGIGLDLDAIDYGDPKVYEMISQGRTEGVFQLESSGMTSFMRELQPEKLEDIMAGIALYRPGPMDFIPKYIKGKKDAKAIRYSHEKLRPILSDTYGCIVYQEQVMQIVRDLAGYSLGRSDLVRRAMSKKKTSVMQKERENFIFGSETEGVPGCIKNDIPQEAAERIFDEMTDFAKYAFNKPHAAAYAVVGYQTAWLKYYYPVEFMAAIMTSIMDWTGKIAEYFYECRKMNIKILQPDINEGYGYFSVSPDAGIRYGLLAIKGVGRGVVEAIVREREKNGKFASLTDFLNRMEGRDMNKRCIESLIKAGALDSLGAKRAQHMAGYKDIMSGLSLNKKRNVAGQISLFELAPQEAPEGDTLPDIPEYDARQLLAYEKEALGLYLSGHPLSEYEAFLNKHVTARSLDFVNDAGEQGLYDGKAVKVGGIIADKTVKYTKSGGKPMAFVTIEDLYGTVEVILFPQTYEKYSSGLLDGAVVVADGRASVREDEDAKLICNELIFYNDASEAGSGPEGRVLWLKVARDRPRSMDEVMAFVSGNAGSAGERIRDVYVYFEAEQRMEGRLQKVTLTRPSVLAVSDALVKKYEEFFGLGAVVVK
jgi:DNA polymerase-3 subunit alpha